MLGSKTLRIAVAAVGALVLTVVAWRLYDPGWQYPIKGVDVSHHQGEIDWNALVADDVSFTYIKATEGGDWIDTRFAENWEGAGKTGVLRGAYHFFTLCTSGADQAANMLSAVPDEEGMLPPAVDLEFAGNCSARPTVAEFRTELDAFLDELTAHYRMTPVIYTNAHFYQEYLDDDPPDVVWWIQTTVVPPWGSPEWTIWQHTPGPKAGVDGDVDRNVFRGEVNDLAALTVRDTG